MSLGKTLPSIILSTFVVGVYCFSQGKRSYERRTNIYKPKYTKTNDRFNNINKTRS